MRKIIYKVDNPSELILSGHFRVMITQKLADEIQDAYESLIDMNQRLKADIDKYLIENKIILEN